MTSQHNTPIPGEQQQRDWKAVEDHELVTNSEDDEADAMAKFMEHEWREVVRKAAEAEQRWKVEEAQVEVQRRKEVHGECNVRYAILMQRHHNRHAEPRRLVGRRKQKWRQPTKWRRSIRWSWRRNAQRLRGRQGLKRCKRHT